MKTISITVGIYDTTYRATFHRNGDITVRAPYVKWTGDTGSLAFKRITLSGDDAVAAKQFFSAGENVMAANNGGGALSLQDVLDGNRFPGVRVTGLLT